MKDTVSTRVETLLRDPLSALGVDLLEVQFQHERRWVLRLIVDQAQGIGLNDCGRISEVARRLLYVADLVPGTFSLEVSSPGIYRSLREPQHFVQCVGRTAKVIMDAEWLHDAASAKPRDTTLRGVIESVEKEHLRLRVGTEVHTLPWEQLRKARLDPEFPKAPPKRERGKKRLVSAEAQGGKSI